MKWNIVLTVLVSLLTLHAATAATNAKKPEKRPTKKASSAKPTKTPPKSIIEEFNGLPPADVDFIKELDRQFNEHGNKIRIKVERDNSTETRNSKRTIDGELGYGHYSNQPDEGYRFSKPKYTLYPYAQRTGPVKATHATDETVTEVEITPSHSYELKPIEEVYQIYPTGHYQQASREQQYYHQQQQHSHHQQQNESPVIVLKIPGPAKYAQHLQALLQQYLEIRAAQLYKEIEEQEYQHQQHAIQQQQQQLVHQQQQEQYYSHHHQHHYQHQPQHAHSSKYSQPDPYATQEVYVPMYKTGPHSYVPVQGHYYDSHKSRPTQPTYRKPAAVPTHIAYHSSAAPNHQAYQYETYHQQQQQEVPQHQAQIQYQYVQQQPPTAHEEQPQQYVYEKPNVNFVTPVPEQDDHHDHYQQPPKYQNFAQYHAQHQSPHQEAEEYLPEPKLVENYPSEKHTRVIYKSQAVKAQLQQASQEQSDYDIDHQQQYAASQHQQQVQQVQQEYADTHQQQQVQPEYAAHHQQQEQQEQQDDRDQQQQYIYQAVYASQMPFLESKAFIEHVTPEAINDLHSHGSTPEPEVEPRYNTEAIVAITQKPKAVYNYHAHSPRSNSGHRMHATRSTGSSSSSSSSSPSSSSSRGSTKASSKRDAPYTEEQFKKVNKMVHRMKKKSPSVSTTTTKSPTSSEKSQ